MYPSLHAFTTEAKDRLVAEQYGPAAVRLRDDLQTSLNRAGEEIDALPSLSEFLIEPADETESTDAAYQLWSKTDLAVGARHLRGRALSRRRTAGEPLLPEPAGVRDHQLPGGRLPLGGDRRKLPDRIERAPRPQRQPRHLPERTAARHGRGSRDARLPRAAVHLRAHAVSRVASHSYRAQTRGRHRRPRPGVRLVRLEPRAALCLGHQRLAAAGSRVRAGGRVAGTVLGRGRATTAVSFVCTTSTIAAGSTRSAIPCSRRSITSSISRSSSPSASCCTCCCSSAPRCSTPSPRARRPADAPCCARCARASIASCSCFVVVAVLPVVSPRVRDPCLLCRAVHAGGRGGSRQHRDRRAAPGRRLRDAAAAADGRPASARRFGDGDRRPGHRPGGEPVRRRRAAGDQRTRSLRIAAAADAHAGGRLPTHRPGSDADVCREGGGGRIELPGRRGAGPRRRTRRHRHRAADAAAPGKRAPDRRARSAAS